MCNAIQVVNPTFDSTQHIACILTTDGLTHYVGLDSYGDNDRARRAAVTLACPLIKELAIQDKESVMIYGERDILGPVRIKLARDIPELVEVNTVHRNAPPRYMPGRRLTEDIPPDPAFDMEYIRTPGILSD